MVCDHNATKEDEQQLATADARLALLQDRLGGRLRGVPELGQLEPVDPGTSDTATATATTTTTTMLKIQSADQAA